MPDFSPLTQSAHEVAVAFLSRDGSPVPELDATIGCNAILDCLYAAEEPNFIADVTAHPHYQKDARRVIDSMADSLVDLCHETLERV